MFGYWKEGELNVLATQSAATVVRPAQCFLLREGLRRMERLPLLDAPPAREKARSKGRAAQEGASARGPTRDLGQTRPGRRS
jgi:hypothetical protein